ncbi:MAG: 2-hydroxyacyl-CoA dehydratase family protein [Syntrophales bacterium]|nr:2-hydroxyacyl-CoA dehydratase family protein [Syntrophales bacterium]HOG07233.1 2-hydroxyacyl-CoA dehydratase family protein [Syntrophales bacterium]HPB69647.1 2-hydroxyacyl-CoA dehydratase family protein [Syntrophales bacterium]
MTMTDEHNGLARAERLYRDRALRARELKEGGARLMGYLCLYPPVELMTALGFVPFRVFGDRRQPVTEGNRVLMPAVCPFLRSLIDLGMKGQYAFLDGLVGAHICDVGSMSVHLWRDYVTAPAFVHFLDVPHTVHAPALDFFRTQIEILLKDLEGLSGRRLDGTALRAAITAHNRQRALLRDLYDLRRTVPPRLTGVEAQRAALAVTGLPVEEGNDLLAAVIAEVRQRPLPAPSGAPRLLVWGSVIDDTSLFELVAAAGAEVVTDDICVGTRAFSTDVETEGDPLTALARHYLADIRCPRTYRQADDAGGRPYREDLEARFGYLAPLIRDWRVDGVILQSVMYCDTHGYEIPAVRDYLNGLGVRNFYLEHDYSDGSRQQVRTRVEAFVEMLR